MTRRFILFVLGIAAAGALLNLVREEDRAVFFGAALIVAGAILFLAGRARRRRREADFPAAFVPHVAVELNLRRQASAMHGRYRAVFAVGRNGFTVRFEVPPGVVLQPGVPQRVDVEFLKPDMALVHFSPGTAFSMVDGSRLIADGQVLTKPCTGEIAAA